MAYTLKSAPTIASMPNVPWRVKGIFPTIGLAAIYGPPTSGKSFLAIALAAAIAAGNDWFGHRVKSTSVVYVALEGEGGFPKRLQAWQQFNELPLPENLHFIINEQFQISERQHVTQLASVIPKGSVVFIDTMNRAAPRADENTSEDMGAILLGCKRLCELIEGLVILIHHTGKDIERGLRGHSSLLAALDAAVEVHRIDDCRGWRLAKAKDNADSIEHGFNLRIVELGEDEDGDPISSCAIEPSSEKSAPKPDGLKGNQKKVLTAILAVLDSGKELFFDEAVEIACKTLEHIDSQHRMSRARITLFSLIKSKMLNYDTETREITKP